MKIHEYQAKKLLQKHGVRIPKGLVVAMPCSASQIEEAYTQLSKSNPLVAIKAQIHAGARGKGSVYDSVNPKEAKLLLQGGVKLAKTLAQAREYTETMLGAYLHTAQTGPDAKKISHVYLEEGTDIKREYYLCIVLDRSTQKLLIMLSQEGGMDIEEVAATQPEKIVRIPIEASLGIQAWQCRRIAFALGLSKESIKQSSTFFQALWNCYVKEDISLLEINPLVLDGTGELLALDCKMDLDDNALFRHPEHIQMRDKAEEDPLETQASGYHLNYIRLDGDVGCMVNGAGLAMATMDIIKFAGASPANFLDVGGGANVQTVANGFRIILEDSKVKAIFVNIFGGIVQCDRVAQGIVEAAKKVKIHVPLVVRLQGTNAKTAREILAHSGIDLSVAESLEEGARKVAEAVA